MKLTLKQYIMEDAATDVANLTVQLNALTIQQTRIDAQFNARRQRLQKIIADKQKSLSQQTGGNNQQPEQGQQQQQQQQQPQQGQQQTQMGAAPAA